MFRFDIINALIEKNGYKRYLEIGVADMFCFDQINCEIKHSVDPGLPWLVNRADYKMTSDEFFDSLWDSKLDIRSDYKWDIILIDGMHLADYAYRDIKNSLCQLSKDGVIVVHDANPPSLKCARENPLDEDMAWNGTVWKTIYSLIMNDESLIIHTVDTDWGVSIIKKKGFRPKPYNFNKFLEYNVFAENRKESLNLISIEEFKEKLNNLTWS